MLLFDNFETKQFPEELCTIENVHEPEVHDCNVPFVCVIVDERFSHQCRIEVLFPYTAKDLDSDELLYGWTDGDRWVDHKDKTIHLDNDRVVAWMKIDKAFSFLEAFGVEGGWKD